MLLTPCSYAYAPVPTLKRQSTKKIIIPRSMGNPSKTLPSPRSHPHENIKSAPKRSRPHTPAPAKLLSLKKD